MKVWVDGSFSTNKPDVVGWAFVMQEGDKEPITRFGELTGDICAMRQIGGEIMAVMEAFLFADAQGLYIDTIYYDYSGLKEWALGNWKAKNKYTLAYQQFINERCVSANTTPMKLFVKISPKENKADIWARQITGGKDRHV